MFKLYFICLSLLLIVSDIVQCESEYVYHHEANGWLKLHTTPATWETALLTCHQEGAILASPLNKRLAYALHSVISKSGDIREIFLGTHNLYSEGHVVSVEGVPQYDMEIVWDYEVNSGDCLTMFINRRAYYMYTASCEDILPFICYKKLNPLMLNECGTVDNEYRLNKQTGSCYKLHQEKQTWPKAYETCTAEGGHLVILNDKEEARVVQDMFPVPAVDPNFWAGFHIGLRAWGKDRTWMTIHGERLENVYHEWYPGEPNNYEGTQNIGSFIRNGTLDDMQPEWEAMFVCEKSPSPPRLEALRQYAVVYQFSHIVPTKYMNNIYIFVLF